MKSKLSSVEGLPHLNLLCCSSAVIPTYPPPFIHTSSVWSSVFPSSLAPAFLLFQSNTSTVLRPFPHLLPQVVSKLWSSKKEKLFLRCLRLWLQKKADVPVMQWLLASSKAQWLLIVFNFVSFRGLAMTCCLHKCWHILNLKGLIMHIRFITSVKLFWKLIILLEKTASV